MRFSRAKSDTGPRVFPAPPGRAIVADSRPATAPRTAQERPEVPAHTGTRAGAAGRRTPAGDEPTALDAALARVARNQAGQRRIPAEPARRRPGQHEDERAPVPPWLDPASPDYDPTDPTGYWYRLRTEDEQVRAQLGFGWC